VLPSAKIAFYAYIEQVERARLRKKKVPMFVIISIISLKFRLIHYVYAGCGRKT
jgi:hypothetical protein